MSHINSPAERAWAFRSYARATQQYNNFMDRFIDGTLAPDTSLRAAIVSAESAGITARRLGLPTNSQPPRRG